MVTLKEVQPLRAAAGNGWRVRSCHSRGDHLSTRSKFGAGLHGYNSRRLHSCAGREVASCHEWVSTFSTPLIFWWRTLTRPCPKMTFRCSLAGLLVLSGPLSRIYLRSAEIIQKRLSRHRREPSLSTCGKTDPDHNAATTSLCRWDYSGMPGILNKKKKKKKMGSGLILSKLQMFRVTFMHIVLQMLQP